MLVFCARISRVHFPLSADRQILNLLLAFIVYKVQYMAHDSHAISYCENGKSAEARAHNNGNGHGTQAGKRTQALAIGH